jgi:DNA-directed RNA polymerase
VDLTAQQVELEVSADHIAATNAINEHADIVARGDIDKLPRSKALIARMFGDVRDYIAAEQAKVSRGPGAHLKGWLRRVPADVAAVIALRTTLARVLQDRTTYTTFQTLAVNIGREWVREIQVRDAEQVNPEYYAEAMKRLSKANVSSPVHIKKTLSRVVKNVLDGLYDEQLGESELAHLGKHGLQACMDAGLVEIKRGTNKRGHLVEYVLTEPVRDFLLDTTDMQRFAAPTDCIMMVPPIPWEATSGGGFLTERRQVRFPLISTRKVRRGRHRAYREACSQKNMPQVYKIANYLQSIPYRMNPAVFEHVQRVWQAGGGALKMVKLEAPTKPVFPFPDTWTKLTASEDDLETFFLWKHRMVDWHEQRLVHRSTVWEMSSFVKNVNRCAKRDSYFPVFIDSRGRWYYRGTPNPQGSDAAKAVIQFARKKALGPRGVFWLQVHIANCFGVDKPKMSKRAEWTREHWQELAEGLECPEHSNIYQQADSPFCAIAAAMDLKAAFDSGSPETYESGIPVHMDATCSGLQHFSAMLRDEIGGQYVNLTPGGEAKADIYRRVADLVLERVQQDALGDNLMAKYWLEIGVTRDMAKSPVMTYVYGATHMSVSGGLMIHLMDEHSWDSKARGVSAGKMAGYLTRLIFRAIEDTVPLAAKAMRWLKDLMRHLDRKHPAQYCTPIGMFVNHDYPDQEQERVRVRSCGVQYVVMYKQLDVTKPQRMQNAIAPNFVHSLDAAHLGFTALRMQHDELDMVCIHDSFGTHPCDVDAMQEHIRAAFVHMYEGKDHLNDLAEQLGLNVTYNGRGNLDLSGVLRSEFFFC